MNDKFNIDLLKDVLDYNINLKKDKFYEMDGRKLPRVTSILSETTDSSYLLNWANWLGFKREKYQDVLNNAASIGTHAHNSIERFLLTDSETESYPFKSFKLWYDDICRCNDVKILYVEKTMYNDYFAGTFDLLIEINGKVFLVDFKTSNYVTEKHFLQLAAYRLLIYQNMNINIDGCIILQLDKKEVRYTEYTLDFNIPLHYSFIEECHRTYIGLVYTFYNIYNVRGKFNELFKR